MKTSERHPPAPVMPRRWWSGVRPLRLGFGLRALVVFGIAAWGGSGRLAAHEVVVVSGPPGEEAFEDRFQSQVARWEAAARGAGVDFRHLSGAGARAELASLVTAAAASERADPLWIVLVGHGTFDGRVSKFNLEGSDVSADELAEWAREVTRPLVVVNTAPASAPFLKALSADGRVVVTATKDASEGSATYFGTFFARAFEGDAADIDNDGVTSLLEAFLFASRGVREFFEGEGRIATEQALLDDNGDGKGTPADRFRGVVPIEEDGGGDRLADGLRAHQISLVPHPDEAGRSAGWIEERDRLERDLFSLRRRKKTMDASEYRAALEEVLLEIARHYEQDGEEKSRAEEN